MIKIAIIKKLPNGKYRLFSRKKDSKGKRKNLGTFDSLSAAKKHEGDVQFFKAHSDDGECDDKETKALKQMSDIAGYLEEAGMIDASDKIYVAMNAIDGSMDDDFDTISRQAGEERWLKQPIAQQQLKTIEQEEMNRHNMNMSSSSRTKDEWLNEYTEAYRKEVSDELDEASEGLDVWKDEKVEPETIEFSRLRGYTPEAIRNFIRSNHLRSEGHIKFNLSFPALRSIEVPIENNDRSMRSGGVVGENVGIPDNQKGYLGSQEYMMSGEQISGSQNTFNVPVGEKLASLANTLDKLGKFDLADEIDNIIRLAVEEWEYHGFKSEKDYEDFLEGRGKKRQKDIVKEEPRPVEIKKDTLRDSEKDYIYSWITKGVKVNNLDDLSDKDLYELSYALGRDLYHAPPEFHDNIKGFLSKVKTYMIEKGLDPKKLSHLSED